MLITQRRKLKKKKFIKFCVKHQNFTMTIRWLLTYQKVQDKTEHAKYRQKLITHAIA